MRLAAFLAALLAVAPACAATVPPLPDADRIQTYSISAPTQTFGVPFAVYGDCSDIDVYVGQQVQNPLTYSCFSASGQTAHPITDMQVQFPVPLTTGTVTIVGDYHPRNAVIPTAPGLTRTEYERTVNTLLAGLREVRSKAEAAAPAQVFGQWDPLRFYAPNSVVGFGNQLYQAQIGNTNQEPDTSPTAWALVTQPVQQLVFNTPTLPGAPDNILAAPTIDIGTATTHFVNVTGAAAISSFGSTCSASAPIYYVSFAGASTLVAGPSMILPGGGNIGTAAGDLAVVQCLGSGSAAVVGYQQARTAPGFPAGALLGFNLATCPVGWITANGTNGTPDMRGNFPRGVDAGAGVDPNRTVGTLQLDELQAFTVTTTLPIDPTAIFKNPNNGSSPSPVSPSTEGIFPGTLAPVAPNTTLRMGAETRPRNVALLYCQKT